MTGARFHGDMYHRIRIHFNSPAFHFHLQSFGIQWLSASCFYPIVQAKGVGALSLELADGHSSNNIIQHAYHLKEKKSCMTDFRIIVKIIFVNRV